MTIEICLIFRALSKRGLHRPPYHSNIWYASIIYQLCPSSTLCLYGKLSAGEIFDLGAQTFSSLRRIACHTEVLKHQQNLVIPYRRAPHSHGGARVCLPISAIARIVA